MRALFIFHVRVGARLALRAAAPLAGVPVIGFLLQQDPSAALHAAARWLVGAPADIGGGVALTLVCVTLAAWATPRVTLGLGAWPRHLPASERAQRRAALLAVSAAQASVAVAAVLFALLVWKSPHHVSGGRLLALPLTAGGAALACWPGRGAFRSRSLAVAALVLLVPASGPALVGAALLLVAGERCCGPLVPRARRPGRPAVGLPMPLAADLRALGPQALLPVLPALVPLAAMTGLRLNNDLAPGVARGAARFGGALSVVFLLAAMAVRVAQRRPVWPWSRSLPTSAAARVLHDAGLLAAPCLVPVGATAALDPWAALAVGACLPSLAVHAAGAVRPPRARESSPGGEVIGPGLLLAATVALLPAAALVSLVALPLLVRRAAARERERPAGRWDELQHRSEGDPSSWSAR